jgi:mRNA-degrading endonuclease RelE of RelBE toxin-antitoxin system
MAYQDDFFGTPLRSVRGIMFSIDYAEGVAEDIARLRAFDRTQLLDRVEAQLTHQPTQETRNKKLLPGLKTPWDAVLSVWELRVGDYRVFYDVDNAQRRVTIRAIRRKPPHTTTEEIL